MRGISVNTSVLIFFIGIIAILISSYVYTRYDFFTGSPVCGFKTLGTYKLTTSLADLSANGAKGLIYIPAGASLTSPLNWNSISAPKSNDAIPTFKYTSFTPTDMAGIDVKKLINNVMACNNIPEFDDNVGVNSKSALILALQSNNTVNSRVFFVKCFVPTSQTAADRNVIVGEMSPNTSNQIYNGNIKPVEVIQAISGTPNLTDTYTLSYVLCPAASRPAGFAYTDCCKSVSETTGVVSTAMTSDDLKTAEECKRVRDSSGNTDASGNRGRNDSSGNRDRRHEDDPNCKRGKYSTVTGGICTGTKDVSGNDVDNDRYNRGNFNRNHYRKHLRNDDRYDRWDSENNDEDDDCANDGRTSRWNRHYDEYDYDNEYDNEYENCGRNNYKLNTSKSRNNTMNDDDCDEDCNSITNSLWGWATKKDDTSCSNSKQKGRPNEHSWPQKYYH
jgi:hypothetical protein